MAKSVRQEVIITINNEKYVLRPTFLGLDKLEAYLNMSIFNWVQMLAAHQMLKLRDIAMVVHCGLIGDLGKDTPTVEELGEQILAHGQTMELVPDIVNFLVNSVLDEDQAAEVHHMFDEAKDEISAVKKTKAKKKAKKKTQ